TLNPTPFPYTTLFRSREIARRGDDVREHDRQLRVRHGEEVQLLLLAHDSPPVRDHVGEARAEIAELLVLAAIQRDAFGVLAQARSEEHTSELQSHLNL